MWWTQKILKCPAYYIMRLTNRRTSESEAGFWPRSTRIPHVRLLPITENRRKIPTGEIRNQFLANFCLQTRLILKLNSRSRWDSKFILLRLDAHGIKYSSIKVPHEMEMVVGTICCPRDRAIAASKFPG